MGAASGTHFGTQGKYALIVRTNGGDQIIIKSNGHSFLTCTQECTPLKINKTINQ